MKILKRLLMVLITIVYAIVLFTFVIPILAWIFTGFNMIDHWTSVVDKASNWVEYGHWTS